MKRVMILAIAIAAAVATSAQRRIETMYYNAVEEQAILIEVLPTDSIECLRDEEGDIYGYNITGEDGFSTSARNLSITNDDRPNAVVMYSMGTNAYICGDDAELKFSDNATTWTDKSGKKE